MDADDFDDHEEDEQNDTIVQDKEFREYIANVAALESIHKIVHVQHYTSSKKKKQEKRKTKTKPYLLSLRVVTPAKHPVSSATTLITTSNQTFSNSGQSARTLGSSSIPLAPYQKPSLNTVSLLAGFTSNLSLTFHDIIREGENLNNKEMAPRILLTYTNVRDEFYESELTYDELSMHRKDMNMDKLTWSDYLKHMHRGLFLYYIKPDENETNDEEQVRIEFDEENDDSKDLIKVTITSPLLDSGDFLSSDRPQIRLKYAFQLYAVRDPNDFSDKLQSLVFDMAMYSTNLYRTRVIEDKKTIDDLRKQLREKSEQLQDANDRLSLFQPSGYNDDPIAAKKQQNVHTEIGGDHDSDSSKKSKTILTKRKAPKSLLNPAQKRRAGGGGARIQ
jgi:hypothetical protein